MVIVRPLGLIASLFSVLIDLLVVNLFVEGIAMLSRGFSMGLKTSQGGRVSGYLFIMFCSILIFAVYFLAKSI
jgi:hypothetical protein